MVTKTYSSEVLLYDVAWSLSVKQSALGSVTPLSRKEFTRVGARAQPIRANALRELVPARVADNLLPPELPAYPIPKSGPKSANCNGFRRSSPQAVGRCTTLDPGP